MNLDDALHTFIVESRELLLHMEDSLLACERGIQDKDSINAIFRAAHTIKGSAGLFGLGNIVGFTHIVESVLDRVRSGSAQLNSQLISLLLRCGDQMGRMIDDVEQQVEPSLEFQQVTEVLVQELMSYLNVSIANENGYQDAASNLAVPEADIQKTAYKGLESWHISLRLSQDTYRNGMDPLSFIRFLATIGQVQHVEMVMDGFPSREQFDPESCYIALEINFIGDCDKATIEDVFEFIREDCELRIIPPHSKLDDYIELIQSLPEEDYRLGEILVRCGSLTDWELDQALNEQHGDAPDSSPPIGEILVEHQTVDAQVVEAALDRQQTIKESRKSDGKYLRIEAQKLDELINLVGELIIAGAGTKSIAQSMEVDELIESTTVLSRLVDEVRDSALKLRMVPIGATFNRFRRIVRDLSRSMQKDIRLHIQGAETELDKTLVERIGDPLLHLVRNAVDHGIEAVKERNAIGKPSEGQVSLNAYHDAGYIVIGVSDDGKGLDPEIILAKAREKGIVNEDQSLSRSEIFDLIFEPGFSTANNVSDISGRGVGMDVVKRNITELRGRIDVLSERYKGTTIRIMLPLTLAIIDGFLVGVQESAFVLPLESVQECVELVSHEKNNAMSAGYVNLRDEALPLIDLQEHFGISGKPPSRRSIVVVNAEGNRYGVLVDRLAGELQTVIKPMGELFRHASCLGGSTILGSGDVALILDVNGLIAQAALQEQRKVALV